MDRMHDGDRACFITNSSTDKHAVRPVTESLTNLLSDTDQIYMRQWGKSLWVTAVTPSHFHTAKVTGSQSFSTLSEHAWLQVVRRTLHANWSLSGRSFYWGAGWSICIAWVFLFSFFDKKLKWHVKKCFKLRYIVGNECKACGRFTNIKLRHQSIFTKSRLTLFISSNTQEGFSTEDEHHSSCTC